jgi:hypothetical protein
MGLRAYIFAITSVLLFGAIFANAQSRDQNFPTPVTTNEINGSIKARDIGDSRLTTYFYTFNGVQGDIFVNVVTKNFNGDIDIFAVDGLKSLTKVVVYADTSASETGRLIYLRKPEKLLLRIEGRSPNDDPATFRIKFGGSFVAAEGGTDMPETPEVRSANDSDVLVNSVGTIIGVKPKPTPAPRATVARVEPQVKKISEKTDEEEDAGPDETVAKKEPEKKPRVLVSENIPPAKKSEAVPKKEVGTPAKRPVKPTPKKMTPPAKEPKEEEAIAENTEKKPESKPPVKPKTTPAPNPLESIQLVILFKDGKKIERPMSEVVRFNVDKGVLTVILKDGTMAKHSLLDVEKVTIE